MLFPDLLLAYAKIENSVYSAKHIVGGNFACYVAGLVDVLTQNGRDESSPVIFLEYARHGVFFCSCCNLLFMQRKPSIWADLGLPDYPAVMVASCSHTIEAWLSCAGRLSLKI